LKRSDSPKRRRVAAGIYREGNAFVAGFTHPVSRNWTTRALPGVSTVTAAKKARARLLSDLEAGRVAPLATITVATFAAEWLAGREGRVRPRTFDADGRNVGIITRRLGALRLQELDGRRLEQFLQEMRSGKATGNVLAERTVLQCYATLRQILDHAVISDLIAINPCAKVAKHLRPKAVNTRKPHPLTPEEIERLIAAASPAYAPIIATAAFTGARIREVLGLRWCDVDSAAKLLSVSKQIDVNGTALVSIKTDAGERVNAIIPKLEPYLGREARMRARWSHDDDFVFSVRKDRPREYRNVRRALAQAAKQAGLANVRCHDLRHTFTSAALQHGDLATVSGYVRHANVGITAKVYAHALGSPAERAARVAEAVRSAGLGH
jgi:integrase